MSSSDSLSLGWILVWSPALVGLNLPLAALIGLNLPQKALIGIVRKRKILTCTQEQSLSNYAQ
jgi:hypothetical protein